MRVSNPSLLALLMFSGDKWILEEGFLLSVVRERLPGDITCLQPTSCLATVLWQASKKLLDILPKGFQNTKVYSYVIDVINQTIDKQQHMPPKPWETRQKKIEPDLTQMVRANNLPEPIPTKEIPAGAPLPDTDKPTTTPTIAGTSSYSSPYSSSYGGYGGGMGMGMGMGMGGMYGGMGGYGMMGMMGNQDPSSTLSQSLYALQSFGYLISMLGQIGKTLEGNIDGISHFGQSFKNLCARGKTFTREKVFSFLHRMKEMFLGVVKFVKEKVLLLGNKDKNSANKVLNIAIRVLFVVFAVSMYPVVKKMLKTSG